MSIHVLEQRLFKGLFDVSGLHLNPYDVIDI